MARKNRSIAGFEDVAILTNENVNVNANIYVEEEKNKLAECAEEQEEIEDHFLVRVIEGKVRRKDLVLVGVYLDPQIAEVLDRLGKKAGRGAKSEIVNNVLRSDFEESGLLK